MLGHSKLICSTGETRKLKRLMGREKKKKKILLTLLLGILNLALLLYYIDVISILSFHLKVQTFAAKEQIKADFYLYDKQSVS